MADPFSTAAAAISLVDVAIKSAREISNFIASLKDASETLRQTHEAVCEVQRLLEDLQHLEDTYRKSSMAHINPQSLSSIRRAIKSINEDLSSLRVKIDEPIFNTDSLSRRFFKSLRIRNKERSITKICSRLEQRVLFTHTTLSVLGRYISNIRFKGSCAKWALRNNDLVQNGALAIVNSNTQLVLRNQTQFQHDTLGTLHSNTAASQQLLREQQALSLDLLEGQTRLGADILDAINTIQVNNHAPILLHEGSANDAAATLSVVRRLLPPVLVKTALPRTSIGDLSWVKKEVDNILRGVYALADSELRGRHVVVPSGSRRTTQKIAAQALHFIRSQQSSVMMQSDRNRRCVQTISIDRNEEMELAVHLPEGNLSVWIAEGCRIDAGGLSCTLRGFRIMFAPNEARLLPGISASYFESSESHLKIPSAVCTFGVVPPECEIIDRICDGDIEEVQAILQRGECSAADRDITGRSLLAVRNL